MVKLDKNKGKQKKISYGDAIKLGFKRQDEYDGIFYEDNGYQYFIVALNLTKWYSFDWDSETHFVTLWKGHDYIPGNEVRYDVADLEELKFLITLLEK